MIRCLTGIFQERLRERVCKCFAAGELVRLHLYCKCPLKPKYSSAHLTFLNDTNEIKIG